ncbi:unnamed protein product [Diamesa hyperborea]
MQICLFSILIFNFSIVCFADLLKPLANLGSKEERLKAEKYPACKSCKVFADSFNKGLEKTTRGKHDGGDAAWEEERLGSYKTSELRLVEIQELLCQDIGRGETQCHTLAEDQEHEIEEWWFKQQAQHPDFYDWFCIQRLKVCCQPNHYGADCKPCSECFGNGQCKGNGTRKGNGKCACDNGYTGETCQSCDISYYEAFRDDTKLLCSICHVACADGGCSGPGPKNCKSCRTGWYKHDTLGCVDIDECTTKTTPACPKSKFCVNNEGSFTCLECDKSCNGCDGDGPDLCEKCAEGFDLRDGLCTDLTNEKRGQYVNFTRYITYFGLCVATCIIFQSSTWLAATVGLGVAAYISLSEYWIKNTPEPQAPSQKILEAAMGMQN